MLTYRFEARDPLTGNKVRSQVQAPDEKSAAKAISAQGYIPLDISNESESGGFSIHDRFFGRIKTKDKVIFSRQLSTLINAGLPIVQSLRNVEEQITNKRFKLVIQNVIADVEGGSTLADALSQYPTTFNRVFISLIAAGETSGTLDAALERLANQQEKDAEIVSKVRGAMVYPLIVIFVMIAVITFMITTVLPHVEEIYDGIPGAKLPIFTIALLALAHAIIKFWWLIIVLFGLAVFATTKWARSGPGKEVIDKFKMKAWPFGILFMKVYMARFARTGQTLIASGVPVLQMLSIVSDAVNNVHVSRSIDAASEKVKGGKALSEAIKGDDSFLPLVPNMLQIGEQSGSMEKMMGKTADYYEKEVDNEIRAISTTIEPVLLIILGLMAMLVVAAVLLPIYSLANKTIVK